MSFKPLIYLIAFPEKRLPHIETMSGRLIIAQRNVYKCFYNSSVPEALISLVKWSVIKTASL